MKRLLLIAAAAAAVFISGCASDKEFLKAQADAIVAQATARTEEARSKAEEARAVIAVSQKLDAGGAAAYVLGLAFKGLGVGSGSANTNKEVMVQRPPGFLEWSQEARGWIRDIGSVGVPLAGIMEQGKTARAGYQRDVAVEGVRQTGESSRITSVAAIGSQVAAHQPNPNVTTILSGTGVLGSGTYTGPVSTITNRNCGGGTGAAGGSGGAAGATTPGGAAGTGGAAPGGTC